MKPFDPNSSLKIGDKVFLPYHSADQESEILMVVQRIVPNRSPDRGFDQIHMAEKDPIDPTDLIEMVIYKHKLGKFSEGTWKLARVLSKNENKLDDSGDFFLKSSYN